MFWLIYTSSSVKAYAKRSKANGFTLLELLLVIAIFGLLAAVTLPALKGISKGTAIAAASRQLLDDVAAARLAAISGRSEVYVVFLPPFTQWRNANGTPINFNTLPANEGRIATNLLDKQLTAYAIFAARQVGDQPGQSHPRYLTPWRSLPKGTFFAAKQFQFNPSQTTAFEVVGTTGTIRVRPFAHRSFPFPTASSGTELFLPCIGFDSFGRLVNLRREVVEYEAIALAQGSVMALRDANGVPRLADVSALETPPGNSTNTFNVVVIDWLTGRARVERRQVK